MPRYPDLHQYLKDLVRPALEPFGEKARLARMWGVRQSYLNQWLTEGRHNPGVDKLPALADFLGIPLDRLFSGVQKTTSVTTPVRSERLPSPSQATTGGPTNVQPTTGASESAEIRALRIQVSALAHELLRVSETSRRDVSRARGRKPSSR